MYKPSPRRPKKTSIVRTKTGCHTCRARHRKCDEAKPSCLFCIQRGFQCEGYAPRYSFRRVNVTPGEIVDGSSKTRRTVPVTTRNKTNSLSPSRRLTPTQTPKENPTFIVGDDAVNRMCSIHSNATQDTGCAPSAIKISRTTRLSDPPSVSPSAEDVDYIYLAHYQTSLKTQLPDTMVPSVEKFLSHPIVRNALLALSASDMAHSRTMSYDDTGRLLITKPSYSNCHLAHGVRLYGAAIQALHYEDEVSPSEPEALLLAATLCCLFERTSGSPRGCYTHAMGAQAIVAARFQEIAMTDSGRSLLCTWAELHAYRESHKLSFRVLELEKKFSVIRTVAQAFANRKALACMLHGEAYAIHRRLKGPKHGMRPGSRVYSIWITRPPPATEILSVEGLLRNVEHLQRLLDAWHGSIAPEDLPVNGTSNALIQDHGNSTTPGLRDPMLPLRFSSFKTALGHLYYATARLLVCSEGIPQSGKFAADRGTSDRPINIWAHLVLRILTGLDYADPAAFSPYEECVLWILWTACCACPDPRVTCFVLDHLSPRISHTARREAAAGAILSYRPLFHTLHQILVKGHRPHLIETPSPADRDLGPDGVELVAIHTRGDDGGGHSFDGGVRLESLET
ncbi:hypothetical protein BO71DRAFT_435490 [Aspergillus ellipticus CBS 707.79]|uniref:Zn(2)-C6 fungal-type domain-containing protein n=1 Tax=Aspergillus ellipticus CBS 707.79 TaxID=1448320 RepID=A0A319DKY8_9EURO|nr:hypothetical protein BO71DRAFT_435490 [Aspergillus ellipticus CBS 707.79]